MGLFCPHLPHPQYFIPHIQPMSAASNLYLFFFISKGQSWSTIAASTFAKIKIFPPRKVKGVQLMKPPSLVFNVLCYLFSSAWQPVNTWVLSSLQLLWQELQSFHHGQKWTFHHNHSNVFVYSIWVISWMFSLLHIRFILLCHHVPWNFCLNASHLV